MSSSFRARVFGKRSSGFDLRHLATMRSIFFEMDRLMRLGGWKLESRMALKMATGVAPLKGSVLVSAK